MEMIEGWTDGRILDHLRQLATGVEHVIEIGVWKGRSTAVLAAAASGFTYCVDTWEGSPGERDTNHTQARDDPLGVYMEFLANCRALGLMDRVIPITKPSTEAAIWFPDQFAGLIYLDGDHEYEAVKADLIAWWPKVKAGGVICGDDYVWPGVGRAVMEFAIQVGLTHEVWYDSKFWVIHAAQ